VNKNPEVNLSQTNQSIKKINKPQENVASPIAAKEELKSENEEKKDAIPLLIIDVNIRPGVKKKIYVFDGDTADGLAEKFSKEHSMIKI
jgi:hypothetical protein